MSDQAWFIGFCCLVLLLGGLEQVFSQPVAQPPYRVWRWTANIGLGVFNIVIASLLPVGLVWSAQWAVANDVGLLQWIAAPGLLAIAATVVIRSVGQYLVHRLAHGVPALWAIHRVHHCDTHIDATTALRNHPFELIVNAAVLVPIVIATGLDPAALAVFETVELIFSIVTHTSLRLPQAAEKSLRPLFITPGLHRLHHSDFVAETDSNFGTVFSLWDRIFGTYLAEPLRPPDAFKFGLEDIDAAHAADFDWLLASPLRVWRSQATGEAPPSPLP